MTFLCSERGERDHRRTASADMTLAAKRRAARAIGTPRSVARGIPALSPERHRRRRRDLVPDRRRRPLARAGESRATGCPARSIRTSTSSSCGVIRRPASPPTARSRSRSTRSCARWAARSTDAPTSSSAARSPDSSARCCSPSAAISTRGIGSLTDVELHAAQLRHDRTAPIIGARSARSVPDRGRRRAGRGARRHFAASSARTSRPAMSFR